MSRSIFLSLMLFALAPACGGGENGSTGGGGTATTSSASSSTSSSSSSSSSGTGGAASSSSSSSSSGTGGTMNLPPKLDDVLAALRTDRDGTLQDESAAGGWPLPTDQGWLFVSVDPALTKLAGDHDNWMPEAMTADQGFAWIVEPSVPVNDHYKFTDGQTYASDPWSRSVNYDTFGEISIARAAGERLDRWFGVGDAKMDPRTVRVWVPADAVTHELYVHDGQNLFDPDAIWGGWHLQDSAPAGMLLIGIDNTPARMDEYTHVSDHISGMTVGGKGDDYADFLQLTVRPLIKKQYGEPGPVGVMGSSLGGLISFEVAYRYPNDYAFAASLSGTMGWGSIGVGIHNLTMIERYDGTPHEMPILYLDSGGSFTTCADSDNDGIDDDDQSAEDNYCENAQMKAVLLKKYTEGTDLYYWYEPGAQHNEAEWAARVFRPLQIFAGL